MEKDESYIAEALPRAKEIFKVKARVFDLAPYLRDMRLNKLDADSPQTRAWSVSEYREILHGLMRLLL